MRYFSYTDKETELLARCDEKLGDFIDKIGHIDRIVFDDVFEGLCYNIVGQQLSMKACETLWGKLVSALGDITPEGCSDHEKLRACGLSQSKAECISAVAQKYISGSFSDEMLRALPDEEIIKALTAIKGIGVWTAEMALIFCLERKDVLSLSDYGIRKGLYVLHGIEMTDKKTMNSFIERYSPYGTIASFYLWEIARI